MGHGLMDQRYAAVDFSADVRNAMARAGHPAMDAVEQLAVGTR